MKMSQLLHSICANLTNNWSDGWRDDFPIIPECEVTIFPIAVFIYLCLSLPCLLYLSWCRHYARRRVSWIFISLLVVDLVMFLINTGQLFYLVSQIKALKTLYVSPIVYMGASFFFFLNVLLERDRNAQNSFVSFFLLLLILFVAFTRCWNHLMFGLRLNQQSYKLTLDRLGLSVYNYHVLAATDVCNLVACSLLFVLGCFSDKRLELSHETGRPLTCCSKQPSADSLTSLGEKQGNHHQVLRLNSRSRGEDSKPVDCSKTAGICEQGDSTEEDPNRNKSPEESASFLSRITYAWFTSLLIRGYRKPLELSDLWQLDTRHHADELNSVFFEILDAYVLPHKRVNLYKERRRQSLVNVTYEQSSEDTRTRRRSGCQGGPATGLLANYLSRPSDGHHQATRPSGRLTDDEQVVTSSGQHPLAEETAVNREAGQLSSDEVDEKLVNQSIAKRQSVRIRVGDKPAFLPGQSASRSGSMVKHGVEERGPVNELDVNSSPDGKPNHLLTTEGESEEIKLATSPEEVIVTSPQGIFGKLRPARDSLLSHKRKSGGSSVDFGSQLQRSESQSRRSTSGRRGRYGLLNALMATYWPPLLQSVVLKLLHDVLNFANPMLLKLLLNYLQHSSEEPVWHGYFFAVSMLFVAELQTLILQRYFYVVNLLGMHLQTTLTSAVYRKTLRLNNSARAESTAGQIVNFISTDVQQFVQLMPYVNMVWSGPLQIIVSMVLLWNELGVAVLAGIAVLLILLPCNIVVAKISRRIQVKKLAATDSRVKMINEFLNGIRVIKLNAWEPSFIREINSLRKKEMYYLRRYTFTQSISFLWVAAPFLVALSSFSVYLLISKDNILDAQKAFVSLSLFNILRFPLFMFPMVTSNLIQTLVSLRRLNSYLESSEINPDAICHEDTPGVTAVIERGVFGWNPEDDPVLTNISIGFPEGQLTTVMGTVGSGKSSLLSALLGEIDCFSGRVNVKGVVAYVPQEAWIFNASLRQNILFQKAYDPVRYKRVIRAAGLLPDLQILPNGDLTDIGDKGINLSGGQKQRVSLARACYADADVYLLDDPLSAVDAHVGRHLMQAILHRSTGLLADKTCVLTTHSPKVLPYSDRVILLSDGQVCEVGTYRQLLQPPPSGGGTARPSRLAVFLADSVSRRAAPRHPETGEEEEDKEAGQETDQVNTSSSSGLGHHQSGRTLLTASGGEQLEVPLNLTGQSPGNRSSLRRDDCDLNRQSSIRLSVSARRRTVSTSSSFINQDAAPQEFSSQLSVLCPPDEEPLDSQNNAAVESTVKKVAAKPVASINKAEVSATGRVKFSVFKVYMRHVGWMYGLLIVILYPLTSVAAFGSNLWLADWSGDSSTQQNLTDWLKAHPGAQGNASAYPGLQEKLDEFYAQRNYRIGIYALLGFIQTLASLFSILAISAGHLKCCRQQHDNLLVRVLHAPVGFFDSVPLGRIVNRFSQDIATMDGPLLETLKSTISTFIQCLLILCLSMSVNPWIIIPLVALTVSYIFIQNLYVTTSRQIKRIQSNSRSPIYSHLSETLLGLSTIRAYRMANRYQEINSVRLDTHNSAAFASMMAQRWLAIILETVANLIVMLVAVFSVAAGDKMSPGSAGLVVTYAMSVSQTLNWLVRMSTELETNIVSVERIHEYCNLDSEAPWEVPEHKPPASWPKGEIVFENYSTRYREDLDPVLRSVNLKLKQGERVGIVGRTGSGKSSMVMGLFRILEPAKGRILIDSVDVTHIGLHDLRGRLTLIPQDPVLFSGTLRFNLDPFSHCSDESIWTALEQANLKTYIQGADNGRGLDMVIAEGGSNFSLGQRQLLCLARALLRRTAILVLDEATAAVDLVTDGLIQQTIRDNFSRCTVLTIAHRLNTILDYHKVVVLHSGEIVEMGTPDELLQNHSTKFYALAKDAHLIS